MGKHSQQDSLKRALSGAGRAQKAEDFSFIHGKAHVLNEGIGGIAEREMTDLYHGFRSLYICLTNLL